MRTGVEAEGKEDPEWDVGWTPGGREPCRNAPVVNVSRRDGDSSGRGSRPPAPSSPTVSSGRLVVVVRPTTQCVQWTQYRKTG